MKTRVFRNLTSLYCAAACFVGQNCLYSQQGPQFTGVQRLTNKEIALTLTSSTGVNYRVETGTNLFAWEGLVTFPSTTAQFLQYTDSAAPFLISRFYRAEQLSGTGIVAGDHLPTLEGDVVIQPRNHATFVMNWKSEMIYVDPQQGATFSGLPKADLILVTHSHSDHFDVATVDLVRKTNTVILAPQAVYLLLSAAQKAIAGVLTNGASTNLLGLGVEAVPAYNSNHPKGQGNGYVLTIGGKRVYVAGDTGDTPEMRQLTGIDVCFLPMNQPYTLTVTAATNVVTAFRPNVVYPYHYRDQSGTTTSAALFKQRLSTDLGVEVRLRKWY